MVSLLYKIRFILVLVFFIFEVESSTSSSLENNQLLIERLDRMQTEMDAMRRREVGNGQLTERLDRMQTRMDAMRSREEVLEVENAQLTERLDEMQTEMDAVRSRLKVFEVENDQWTKKFDDVEAENEQLRAQKLQQDEELQHLKNQISHLKFSLSASKRDDGQSSRVLSSPPTSCQELKNQNGLWPMDGIHLLKKQDKIKAAFCTFPADGSPVSEVLIGQIDVKTKIVHFYVQRNSNFSTQNAVIPFDLARLNEGGAFNLTSGIFKVPVSGIYHFDFSAVHSNTVNALWVDLQVNGANVCRSFTSFNSALENAVFHRTVSLIASLRLKAGDRVNLYNANYGVLYDTNDLHCTHFSGWLVEDELM